MQPFVEGRVLLNLLHDLTDVAEVVRRAPRLRINIIQLTLSIILHLTIDNNCTDQFVLLNLLTSDFSDLDHALRIGLSHPLFGLLQLARFDRVIELTPLAI